MAHSSLIGIDRAALEPAGRDIATLGPSDSSDSGSDMSGIDEEGSGEPTEPVDVALRGDAHRGSTESGDDSASDSTGTGENRSAAGDAGGRDGADISADRVFDAFDENVDDVLNDSDLDAVNTAASSEMLDDEDEDSDAPIAPT